MAGVNYKQFFQRIVVQHMGVVAGTMDLWREVGEAARMISCTLQDGGKVMVCGNGGSAADAQHMAAELAGRFKIDRAPQAAIALTTDTSIITAVANDYGYADIFSRQVRGLGRPGDVLVAISTSGNSPNVLEATKAAREVGVHTIGLTGTTGAKLVDVSDVALVVPSADTARIQEAHELLVHVICEAVELHLCT